MAEVVNGPILLAPYDPAWPTAYEDLAILIDGALGPDVGALHHAGSTSVPGLAAKPIIDLILEVADSADEEAYVPALEAAGFTFAHREPDWFEHRLMKFAAPKANLHIFSLGCPETIRMIAFRDHLRRNDRDRALYEQTKKTLAARTWRIVQDYADAKTEVVSEIMSRALEGA